MFYKRTLVFLILVMGLLTLSITAVAKEVEELGGDVPFLLGKEEKEATMETISEEKLMLVKEQFETFSDEVKTFGVFQLKNVPAVVSEVGKADDAEDDEKENATESMEDDVIEVTRIPKETEATEPPETTESTEPVVEETQEAEEEEVVEEETEYVWDGPVLNSYIGTVEGPSGKETYYNLPMSRVVEIMHELGFEGEYWVRDDGVKMFGDYIMVATDLSHRPKGTILPTSLGMGMVCDTGEFVKWNSYQIDIAVAW